MNGRTPVKTYIPFTPLNLRQTYSTLFLSVIVPPHDVYLNGFKSCNNVRKDQVLFSEWRLSSLTELGN